MTGSSGAEGWGDIAPLPGFSREAATEVEEALTTLCEIPLDEVNRLLPHLPASVGFGWTTACWACAAHHVNKPFPEVLSDSFHPVVSINGLLAGTSVHILTQATELIREGYTCLKLKVGRHALEEEVALVEALRRLGPSDMRIRLDANRAWSLEEAVCFGRTIGPKQIEYIEEPVADPEAFPRFAEATGIPVALDESLMEGAVHSFKDKAWVQAVVLKPTLLGVIRVQGLLQEAKESGIRVVFSSSFETGVGLRALIAMASAWGEPSAAVGLGTYRWLATDVLQPRLPLAGSSVTVADVFAHTFSLNHAVVKPWNPT